MKIIAISDTHGFLPHLPKCDVVCICGDISPLKLQRNSTPMKMWLEYDFYKWTLGLNCKKIVMVAGNHDFIFERHPEIEKSMNESQKKLVFLRDEGIEIDGIKFYGTPWCPNLDRWAFYGDEGTLKEKFSQIPENINVLLTHTPPKIGQVGTVLQPNAFNKGANYGCVELAEAIKEKKPKIVLSGHIHSGKKEETYEDIKLYNVSLLDEDYNISYLYTEIDI